MRRRVAATLSLLLAGCEPPPDPVEAYRAFALALQRGDVGGCWKGLSTAAQRQALDEATRARAPLPTGEAEAMKIACGEARVLVARVKEIRVEETSGDRTRLVVTTEQGTNHPVLLVREGASWRVEPTDLSTR